MSTQKTNHPGDSAAKHVSFKPAAHEDSSGLPGGQAPGDNANRQQPEMGQGKSGSEPTGRQQDNQSAPKQAGLEAQAKTWLNQQQWLQNVDTNQLSKQAKDLGNKAVEQVNRLTPTQKVVGGALVVTGLSWLALRSMNNKSKSAFSTDATTADNEQESWKRSTESVYRGRKSHS